MSKETNGLILSDDGTILEGIVDEDMIPYTIPDSVTEIVDDNEDDYYEQDYDDYYERESYGEYAGSYAQDVEGLSDDFINDVLDGDPDAYWNID